MTQASQVEALQDIERLEQRGALRPRMMAVNLEATVSRSHQRFQQKWLWKSLSVSKPPTCSEKLTIERVAPIKPPGLQPRRSSVAARSLLSPNHGFQYIRKVLWMKRSPGSGARPFGRKYAAPCGKNSNCRAISGDLSRRLI